MVRCWRTECACRSGGQRPTRVNGAPWWLFLLVQIRLPAIACSDFFSCSVLLSSMVIKPLCKIAKPRFQN